MSKINRFFTTLFIFVCVEFVSTFVTPTYLNAQVLSPRQTHPIASQHFLPGPEAPGWLSKKWFDVEIVEANFWNAEGSFTNKKTGRTLTHVSDFEQTVMFIEYGRSFSEKWAWAVEIPYYLRHEGDFSDGLIDEFHKAFHFSRYNRHLYPEGRYLHSVTVDGVRQGPLHAPSGVGNIKLKAKYWAVKGKGNTGLGWSTHLKIPVESETKGTTSGSVDISQMLHLGFPVGQASNIYLNAAITYAHRNWMYSEWPRNKILWMGDVTVDAKVTEKMSILFSLAAYSPLMKKSDLEVNYSTTDPKEQKEYLMASGYNGLVEVRGQQSIGVKFDFGDNDYWSLYFIEDWWFGDKDQNGDPVYSHNQPDVGIGTRLSFHF